MDDEQAQPTGEAGGSPGRGLGPVGAQAGLAPGQRPLPPYGHRRFRGRFPQKLDKSGRVVLPTSLRHAFAPGEEFCVVAPLGPYHVGLWTHFAYELFVDQAQDDPQWRSYSPRDPREMDADARELSVDSQYRIVLPPELREEISFGDQIIIIGATDRIEIWNREAREEVLAGVEGHASRLADADAGPRGRIRRWNHDRSPMR